MKVRTRAAWLGSLGMAAVALLTLMLVGACQKRTVPKEAQPETHPENQGKPAAAAITVENGQTFITLDAATQKRLGFAVATLTSSVTRAQATFPAVVVSVQELVTFRNAYVAAQAQLQKARIAAGVAGKEYARLKALAGPEQNVSEKSLQAAEAALQSDQADVRAAEQQMNLQASALRQEWGGVVTEWATQNSAQLQHLLDRGQALVAMTMPAATAFAPPMSVSLELPGGSRSEAAFVSNYPKVDPRIQGRSVLYVITSKSELPPGLNLVAHLPVGGLLKGVVIPASAVVWSEDKAWVYAQVSPERFSRSPVPTDVPVEGGFFAAEGFAAGDKIVTVGAQALLSEEMLLHSQGGGDEE
jgi:membrane fusion protein, multidrug efflux system